MSADVKWVVQGSPVTPRHCSVGQQLLQLSNLNLGSGCNALGRLCNMQAEPYRQIIASVGGVEQ